MIVLREHEKIAVAEQWDSARRTIGQDQLDLLLYHQERHGASLLELGYRSLKASSWVGTLGLGEHCLDVIPKIDDATGSLDERRTRQNLLWMVSRAGLVPIADADIASLTADPGTMLVAFLRLYVQKLAQEWQRGPIRQYVSDEQNRTYLRGKLLFTEQLRHNLFQKHRFYTRTDEFVMDNNLSAILKAALRRCAVQSMSVDVVRDARRLLFEFSEVADSEFSSYELENVQVSRQHQRFELLIRLAKMILTMSSPGQCGGAPIYSLMFDMNVVFERFIASELQVALVGSGLTVRPQLGGRSLLKMNGKPKFQLRPDIGVYRGGDLICLIDTKWKRLDPRKSHFGVSQSDMYQMYAYGKEYDVPLTILLYPRWGNLSARVAEYVHPRSPEQKIAVATVPVSGDGGKVQSAMALRKELAALVA
jgi:5-methylcytosine-specific restriction enzyme subunit McrC